MAFLEDHAAKLRAQPDGPKEASPESAAVITIQGSTIGFTPVLEMVQHADMANRCGINPWWKSLKDLAEILGGRKALLKK